ncbi:MAG: MMPL family transporter [Planctomycetes bacterium]|nr:MMPL family transporter [Planctomycetota bacterium]
MAQPPETQQAAMGVFEKAERIPFLDGTLVSEDGRALAVYLPITAKKYSYPIYTELNRRMRILWSWADLAADIRAAEGLGVQARRDLIQQGRRLAWQADSRDAFVDEARTLIDGAGGEALSKAAAETLSNDPMDDGDVVHITGLPVAEDTFGVQMFIQMAISAPTAMGVIFVLMLVFFRKLTVVISPMIVAMVSVVFTMGSLVIAGFPIHIMSSMIPIFIMPIAVLDSIHIISDFFEKYQQTRNREQTVRAVMDELFVPMLYTSLTSAAGFASLALTPIPPVQVFGVFVAGGILVAWLLTVTFIPAFVMFLSEKRLANFGRRLTSPPQGEKASPRASGGNAATPSGLKAISPKGGDVMAHGWLGRLLQRLGGVTYRRATIIVAGSLIVLALAGVGIAKIRVNDNPVKWFDEGHPIRVADKVLNEHFGGTYMAYLAMEYDGDEPVFKQPDVLRWQRDLQDAMQAMTGPDGEKVVGKSSSLADIVRTVHQNFMADSLDDPTIDELARVPETRQAVAQMLIQFQQSHRYSDIDKFVTPNYRTASTWVQLTSGNNRDMEAVANAVDDWIARNPPPVPLETEWFGLTYINVVWQDKMVVGMLQAFAGSFLVVFLLMTVLFRSGLWGLLSMVPLTVTIAAIYGGVGWVGKDYDMPVAVLSSLTLGLAVDFAIHFLARSREMVREHGRWEKAAPVVFAEPAKAISRNIVVIAAGFTPLLLAPLVPYQTVGVLLATILLVSGVATLLLLPALMRLLGPLLFKPEKRTLPGACNCGLCAIVSTTAAVLLALNAYAAFGWHVLTWIAIGAIPVLALACGQISRRTKCARLKEATETTEDTESL